MCDCCPETCAVIQAFRRGIPEAVRPALRLAMRDGRARKVCEAICPYGLRPATEACLGCGVCALRCPRGALQM